MRAVILLGPQRFQPSVDEAMRALDVGGRIATVSAGWREREPDDAELDQLLGERSVNLRLYGRWTDTVRHDPEYAEADRHRRDRLEELQALYLLRLHHAMAAIEDLRRRRGTPEMVTAELTDAIETVRRLDARHLEQVAQVHADFEATWTPRDRPVIAEHRAAVARLVEGTDAVAIAGGHVAALLGCLRLFGLDEFLGGRPVVAWSAGAMAVSERVVLYHDLAAHSPGHAEVYDSGLGWCRGIVPLPHARRRLRLDDLDRMALLARRFSPARCVVLEDGAQVSCSPEVDRIGEEGVEGTCPVVGEDGRLRPAAA